MKRTLIVFIVSLVVGLGAGTGLVMLRQPHAPAAADGGASAKAPGANAEKPRGDSAEHVTPAKVGDSAKVSQTTPASHPAPADSIASKSGAALAAAPTGASGKSETGKPEKGSSTIPVLPTTKAGPATAALQHAPRPDADSGHVSYLAKTFATMPSRSAAGVMMGMPDEDITLILASMNAKQRGAILGNFPSERATKVARLMLHNSGAP